MHFKNLKQTIICFVFVFLIVLEGCGPRSSVTEAAAHNAASAEQTSQIPVPDMDDLRKFFESHGVSDIMEAGEDLTIFTSKASADTFAGYVNTTDQELLSTAGFQTYGKVPDAETLAFLRDALSLFFSGSDLEEMNAFLDASFQKADRKTEYSDELSAAGRRVLLYIRPENSASPSCEMVISL